MSVRNKLGLCAYCGRRKKLTSDHVPPKLLLERPFPPNLWVVPACADCNQSFIADDEYTRAALAVDIRATWNYAAQSNLPAIIRSLERPDARGFTSYLARRSTAMKIVTPSGSPIWVTERDRKRINRTGMHIMRGLYFRETHRPLPSHAVVRLESTTGLTANHPDMIRIARVVRLLPDHRDGAVGTAFSYHVAFGGQHSVWGMLLYDYFFWVATLDEGEEANMRSGDDSSESPRCAAVSDPATLV
jgi:hypothetical protein